MNPHEHDHSNRLAVGSATPAVCPDCPARPVPGTDGVPLLDHAPSCPVGRDEDRQALADAVILARDPGTVRVRALVLGDAVLAAALTPTQRRRAQVHVRRAGHGGLLRTVVSRGRVVAVAVSTVPAQHAAGGAR